MSITGTSTEFPAEDRALLGWIPLITSRRLILFVIGWLALFTLISVLVSNPYITETSALATPDYFRVMFVHGLLMGMVALAVLTTCLILGCGSRQFHGWIAGTVVVAAVLAAIGGTFNRSVGRSGFGLWTQVISFLVMDGIAILMLVVAMREWQRRSPQSRTLPFVTAVLSGTSMLVSGMLGHLAGWILKSGDAVPELIGHYLQTVGFTTSGQFLEALRLSHSHQMAMGVMGLVVALLARQFGYDALREGPQVLARMGLAMVVAGTLAMTAIYLVMAFTAWQPPDLFSSGQASGIPAHDAITGLLVGGGGVIVLLGLGLGRLIRGTVRWAAAWSWVASFALVVLVGYYIQLHEAFFGAGRLSAPGAEQDAIFTWLHQGFGLFLLPAMVLEMLVAERLVRRGHPAWIGSATIIGVSVVLLGSVIWLFVDPDLYGPGYFVSATGLLIMGAALLATLWWGREAVPNKSKMVDARQSNGRA
jgi:hypothetical protein